MDRFQPGLYNQNREYLRKSTIQLPDQHTYGLPQNPSSDNNVTTIEKSQQELNCCYSQTEDVISSNEEQLWRNAIKKVVESLRKNNTWIIVENNNEIKPNGSKIILKMELDANGNIVRYKARLVGQGF